MEEYAAIVEIEIRTEAAPMRSKQHRHYGEEIRGTGGQQAFRDN